MRNRAVPGRLSPAGLSATIVGCMKAPRLIFADGLSTCCHAKALLVRSREGGFVSRNCLKCKKASVRVRLTELPDIDCDFCGIRLGQLINGEGNYAYK